VYSELCGQKIGCPTHALTHILTNRKSEIIDFQTQIALMNWCGVQRNMGNNQLRISLFFWVSFFNQPSSLVRFLGEKKFNLKQTLFAGPPALPQSILSGFLFNFKHVSFSSFLCAMERWLPLT
jgi:hypothetical protein